MPDAVAFIPGLDLAEALYREVLRPLLDAEFPGLRHSAVLLGGGSDVLGFDTERSRDHEWGPRGQLLLAEDDHARFGPALRTALRSGLPERFRGYSLHFASAGADEPETLVMAEGTAGEIDSRVEVLRWPELHTRILGSERARDPSLLDWLTFSESALLQLTAGRVFHDGLGVVEPEREHFSYYPRDIWLYRMACQWDRISQQEPFVGRARELGDDLGGRVLVSRIAHGLVRLTFLLARRYAPYEKWRGTAFARLPEASALVGPLERAFSGRDALSREQALGEALTLAARLHDELGVTRTLEPTLRPFFSRPYPVIGGQRFAAALRAEIEDPCVRALDTRLGAIDQLVDDASGMTAAPALTNFLRRLYGR